MMNRFLLTTGLLGSMLIGFCQEKSNELHPFLSPDNKQMVFYSNTYGHNDIFIYDLTTQTEKRIASDTADDGNPVWSTDGKVIAFHSNRNGNYDIFLYHLEQQELKQLTYGSFHEMSPSISPDGEFITYESNEDSLWQMNILSLDDLNSEVILKAKGEYLASQWHPNGKELLLSYTSKPGNHDTAMEIVKYDLKTRRLENITQDSGGSSNANISGNGRTMVYNNLGEGDWEIFIKSLKKEKITRITTNDAIDGQPVISSNGKKIFFTSNRTGDFDIYEIKVDGSGLRNLTQNRMKQ